MIIKRITTNPNDLVAWFTQQGYPQAWRSTGWTYEGLDKAWRIQRSSAIPRRWTVDIQDERLFLLFTLKFS
jgi:hypothetical protein